MPNKKLTPAQSRTALRKLKLLGLYTGDLRKTPTKSALDKIKKFAPVLAGKATVVQPKNPAKFKTIFQTVGKNVIVPKRKGEKISVDKKTGEIISKRKVGKRIITSRGLSIKRGEKIPEPAKEIRVQYVIPFAGPNGTTNWMRFPDYGELQKFMAGYDYKGWQDYVIIENVDDEFDDEELDDRLERKRKGRRIKGGLKKTIKATRGRKRRK